LNGREAQAWHGESAALGVGLLNGDFKITSDPSGAAHLTGTLTNAAKSPMTDIIVTTSAGDFRIAQNISPGGTIDVDATVTSDALLLKDLPADVKDVSPERAGRFETLMKEGFAIVTSRMPDAKDVKVGQPVDQHWQILQAAVPVSR
jgi:hypothetical protein